MTRRHAADLRQLRDTGDAMRAQMKLPVTSQETEMKTETVTRYKAFDGTIFDTAADCRAHEKNKAPARLVGLTLEAIQAALDRSDPDLADAFEEVGKRIIAKRYEQGERKRNRKAKGEEANGQTEPQQPDLDAAPPPERQEAFA